MNAFARSHEAYTRTGVVAKSAQSLEYDIFARVTSALSRCSGNSDEPYCKVVAALHENRMLWSVLAADVSEEGNGLPEMLRAQIVYLAEFTRVHSSRVLRDGEPVDPLIEINRSIMKGLFAQRGAV